jgi:hypothetical protein
MLLTEIFNPSSAIPIKWESKNEHGWIGSFKIEQSKVMIDIIVEDQSEAFVEFDVDGHQQLLGKNKNHFIILSTVKSGIEQYIKSEKPTKLHALSDRKEPARARIFSQIFNQVGKKLGYEFKRGGHVGGYDHIILSK